jgi:hypothetical protein
MKTPEVAGESVELRKFGLILGALFAAVFAVIPMLRRPPAIHIWPWCVAVILSGLALLRPSMLRYLHSGWTRLGWVLGWINTRLILTLIYVILIVPLGLIMRLFGRDRMARHFEPNATTYRLISRQRPSADMEHPY